MESEVGFHSSQPFWSFMAKWRGSNSVLNNYTRWGLVLKCKENDREDGSTQLVRRIPSFKRRKIPNWFENMLLTVCFVVAAELKARCQKWLRKLIHVSGVQVTFFKINFRALCLRTFLLRQMNCMDVSDICFLLCPICFSCLGVTTLSCCEAPEMFCWLRNCSWHSIVVRNLDDDGIVIIGWIYPLIFKGSLFVFTRSICIWPGASNTLPVTHTVNKKQYWRENLITSLAIS